MLGASVVFSVRSSRVLVLEAVLEVVLRFLAQQALGSFPLCLSLPLAVLLPPCLCAVRVQVRNKSQQKYSILLARPAPRVQCALIRSTFRTSMHSLLNTRQDHGIADKSRRSHRCQEKMHHTVAPLTPSRSATVQPHLLATSTSGLVLRRHAHRV